MVFGTVRIVDALTVLPLDVGKDHWVTSHNVVLVVSLHELVPKFGYSPINFFLLGKFWHRHRRPRPVEYHTDAEYHNSLRNEAERAKANAKKRGGAAARQALAQQEQTPTPAQDRASPMPSKADVFVDVSPRKKSSAPAAVDISELERPLSPASSVSSTGSERPLAQAILQVNGNKPVTPVGTPRLANAEPSLKRESSAPVKDSLSMQPHPAQAPTPGSAANTPTPAPESRTPMNAPPAAVCQMSLPPFHGKG